MRMKYLYTIEASFFLKGIGKVITATFTKGEKWPELQPGDKIILEKPDKEIITTEVAGFELLNYRRGNGRIPMSIRLPKNMNVEEIPEGTKVYKNN